MSDSGGNSGGSGCTCGGGCKMYPDMSYTESTMTGTLVLGVGAEMEMGEVSAENGCKCGSDCKCDPCTCSK